MSGSKKETLKNSQLFWKLTDSQINTVADIFQEEFYWAGARIFSEGETAHNLYIVEEGKVALEMEIRIGSRTRKHAVIDVITNGQGFGWSAITERPVFTMSAICSENTKLYACNGQQLRVLCEKDKDLYGKVMDELILLVSDRLEHAKRTLAHVLSVTSHDLRAPLATVQSCLDVIVGGFAGSVTKKQEELLVGSKQRIFDLTQMIDNILDISHIEIRELDFEHVSLPEVVEHSIGDVTGIAIQKNIEITNNVSTELPHVLGLPKRLQQVLTNLLGNALKFTPANGSVTVNSLETDDSIQLEVCDTGIGIPQEELPKIFDDFYRGKTVEAEGAGLGLSIAKKIIEAHGGLIWVESPCSYTGTGTQFSFSLPKLPTMLKGKAKIKKDASRPLRILVTDDDPHMLEVTKLVLESNGYQVTTAQNGIEALERIEKDTPDLLILDLLMPKMDGFDVIKSLHERSGPDGFRIPILILSAVKEDSSRRRYELETKVSMSIDDYIEKPIAPPILLQRVERVLSAAQSGTQKRDYSGKKEE